MKRAAPVLVLCAAVLHAPAAIAAATAPVERRLHIGQAEASSYDKNDWNRFEENYLPLYVADDDPTTAWTEGAEGDGVGQWLRLRHSTMKGATRLRLRVRNGYQKTPRLFAANVRGRRVRVKLLPGGTTVERELADRQDFQELVVEQPAGDLSGVELTFLSVFPGKKYADLCISDVQIFVTAETPDNPAYEKTVFERVKKWKGERVAAAAAFKKAAAGRPLPVAPAYVHDDREPGPQAPDCSDGDLVCSGGQAIDRLVGDDLTPPEQSAIGAAKAALSTRLADFQPVQLVADAPPIPALDGTCSPGFGECEFQVCDGPQLPLEHRPLLERRTYRLLDTKEVKSAQQLATASVSAFAECRGKEPRTFSFARREGPDKAVRALFVYTCGLIEGREGMFPTRTAQLLVYGDDGRLRLTASWGEATTYRWEGDGAAPRVAGGRFHTPIVEGAYRAAAELAKAPSGGGK